MPTMVEVVLTILGVSHFYSGSTIFLSSTSTVLVQWKLPIHINARYNSWLMTYTSSIFPPAAFQIPMTKVTSSPTLLMVDAPTRDRDGCISSNSINRSPTSSHLDSDIKIKIGQLKEIYNEEFSKEDDSQRINFQTQTDLSYTGSQSCPSMTKLTKQGRRGMLVLQEQREAYKGKGVQTINQKAYHELHERPSPTPFLQS